MNPQEQSLLKEVLASPDDDALRLIYADAIEESDPAKAEFVRVQVAITNTAPYLPTECKVCAATADEDGMVNHGRGCYIQDENGGGSSAADDNPGWQTLKSRERELLEVNWHPWSGIPSATYCGNFHKTGAFGVTFRRGFVEALTLSAEAWLTHADALYWHPDQLSPCKRCKGRQDWHDALTSDGRCFDCSTPSQFPGRVSRLCPSTALPIKEVTLTTMPPISWVPVLETGRRRCWFVGRSTAVEVAVPGNRRATSKEEYDIALALLINEWPTVAFHLPPLFEGFHVPYRAGSIVMLEVAEPVLANERLTDTENGRARPARDGERVIAVAMQNGLPHQQIRVILTEGSLIQEPGASFGASPLHAAYGPYQTIREIEDRLDSLPVQDGRREALQQALREANALFSSTVRASFDGSLEDDYFDDLVE